MFVPLVPKLDHSSSIGSDKNIDLGYGNISIPDRLISPNMRPHSNAQNFVLSPPSRSLSETYASQAKDRYHRLQPSFG